MESFFPLPFQGFYSPWVFPWSVQGHHRPKSVVFVVYSHFGHVFHQLLLVLVLQVSYNFESILVLSDTLYFGPLIPDAHVLHKFISVEFRFYVYSLLQLCHSVVTFNTNNSLSL